MCLPALFCAMATAACTQGQGIALETLGDGASHHAAPITMGVVLPRDDAVTHGRVVDDLGRTVPADVYVTGWWDAERTIAKWLLLHFKADSDRQYRLMPEAPPDYELRVNSIAAVLDDGAWIDTGKLSMRFNRSGLVASASLDGQAHPLAIQPILSGATAGDWRYAIDRASPLRASLKATTTMRSADGADMARIDLRFEVYRDESFFRLYHTITWLVRDVNVEVERVALRIAGLPGSMRKPPIFYDLDNRTDAWISNDRNVAVGLRHAWQMFPATLACDNGEIDVGLFPQGLSFKPEAIMPEDYYHAPQWKRWPWSKEVGHYVHEYGGNPYFDHTGEGAARTHEMMVYLFDDKSARTEKEVADMLHHPLRVRQKPESACRVAMFGHDIPSVDDRYPGMERAIEQAGRMTVARWGKTHDYGALRFGFTRWYLPGEVSYRWFDGHQYDMQVIPWLLYLRGGAARWAEEGEVTARFAMDVATNHFNTRGYPTGYQAAASAMPLPWIPFHAHKAMKLHYLSMIWHLTGYERAREVMQEVIDGAVQAFDRADDPLKHRGREIYNMNRFWVTAYQETLDPKILDISRQVHRAVIEREYNQSLSVFRFPQIYLYHGLLARQVLEPDDRTAGVMLEHLGAWGLPGRPDGGIGVTAHVTACGWAYHRTGDARFAHAAWDVSRQIADLIPMWNWSSEEVPRYPGAQNQIYSNRLLPMLAGLKLAQRLNLSPDAASSHRDLYVGMNFEGDDENPGELISYIKIRQDGDLRVHVLLRERWNDIAPPTTVTAYDPDGSTVASIRIVEQRPWEPEALKQRFAARNPTSRGELVIPGAKAGDIYRIQTTGGSGKVCVKMIAHADIVHRLGLERNDFYNQAGQYYAGTRLFMKTTADKVLINNWHLKPYAVRDASTNQLLFRSTMNEPQRITHEVGAGRDIVVVIPGRANMLGFEGVAPYVSATGEEWFNPAR